MPTLASLLAKLLRFFDRRPILVFCGDSHVGSAEAAYRTGKFGGRRVRFVRVGGATAIGLRDPESKTRALVKFRRALLPRRRNAILVFQLGEVDCGIVIWRLADKYRVSVDSQIEASLEAYSAFLTELKRAGYKRIIVTSAILPTLRDGVLRGEVARLRKSVTATQRERTDLTLRYNARLRAFVAGLGLAFVDFDADLLDPKTQLLNEAFRNSDPDDHHLDSEKGGDLWVARVTPAADALC